MHVLYKDVHVLCISRGIIFNPVNKYNFFQDMRPEYTPLGIVFYLLNEISLEISQTNPQQKNELITTYI